MPSDAASAIPEESQVNDREDTKQADQLADLLEFEIERIRAEESQSGWTTWALVGSLGAMLLLLASDLEKASINVNNVFFVLLFAWILYGTVMSLRGILQPDPATQRRDREFYLTSSAFSTGRLSLLARAVFSTLLLGVATTLSKTLSRIVLWSVYALQGLVIFACVLALTLSFVQFPLSRSPKRGTRALLVVPILLEFVASVGLATVVLTGTISPSVSECRVGGLLFACAMVLLLLCFGGQTTPLLSTLVNIRRGIVLGYVSVASARSQAEIALIGLNASDVLQQDLVDLLCHLDQMNAHLKAASAMQQGFVTLLSDTEAEPSPEQLAQMKAILDLAQTEVEAANALIAPLHKRLDRFHRRAEATLRAGTGAESEIGSLLEKVSRALDQREAALQDLRRACEASATAILQKVSAAKQGSNTPAA